MAHTPTIRYYLVKVLLILALVIVLTYTFLLNWFFTRGLDESNFFIMNQVASQFAKDYDNGLSPTLPRSHFFNGYLTWSSLPLETQQQFPSLSAVSETSMKSLVIREKGSKFGQPDEIKFLLARPLTDGKIFYLSRKITKDDDLDLLFEERVRSAFFSTGPIALMFLIVILVTVYLIVRRLSQPLSKLRQWSEQLTLEMAFQPRPDFSFDELNEVAEKQRLVLFQLRETIEREKNFIRHASHELRTPIAVIKSSVELLERVILETKTKSYVERIGRANSNMQNLTETLLMLSRNDKQLQEKIHLHLPNLLNQIVEDNRYLINGKKIEISVEIETEQLVVAEQPCKIVVSNLIRNAFQYTVEGNILIYFKQNKLTIKNTSGDSVTASVRGASEVVSDNTDYGYGFGILLVEQIVDALDWTFESTNIENGRIVYLMFE